MTKIKNYNRRKNELYGTNNQYRVIDLNESKLRDNMNGVHLCYWVECINCKKVMSVCANDLIKLTNCKNCKKNDLTGKVFGNLTVIKELDYDTRYGRKRRVWLTKCTCGTEKVCNQEVLVRGDVSNCSKCRPRLRGPDHPWYNPMSDRYNKRDSAEYKKFAKQVFSRDKYKCILCGSNKKLNAHHLNGWHWYFAGRFDPNNAVTLCGHKDGCHNLFHKKYGRKNNTQQQFEQFRMWYNYYIKNSKVAQKPQKTRKPPRKTRPSNKRKKYE